MTVYTWNTMTLQLEPVQERGQLGPLCYCWGQRLLILTQPRSYFTKEHACQRYNIYTCPIQEGLWLIQQHSQSQKACFMLLHGGNFNVFSVCLNVHLFTTLPVDVTLYKAVFIFGIHILWVKHLKSTTTNMWSQMTLLGAWCFINISFFFM